MYSSNIYLVFQICVTLLLCLFVWKINVNLRNVRKISKKNSSYLNDLKTIDDDIKAVYLEQRVELQKNFESVSNDINDFYKKQSELFQQQSELFQQQTESISKKQAEILQLHLESSNNLAAHINRFPKDFGDYRNRKRIAYRINFLEGNKSTVSEDKIPSFEFLKRRMLECHDVVSSQGDVSICVVALGNEYRTAVRGCLESHERFSRIQGHSLVILKDEPSFRERPIAWLKIPLIAKMLDQGKKYIMYIDADAMITNTNIDIKKYFLLMEKENKCILLTEDEHGPNCGVMFVRNSEISKRILELIWLYDLDVHNGVWEQHAFKRLIDEYQCIDKQIMIDLNPRNFNSFPAERNLFHRGGHEQIWSRGDFICHFAGIREPYLQSFVERYERALNA